LRAGLQISQLPDGRCNFSQDQAHDAEVVGIGTVAIAQDGTANILITDGVSKGTRGVAAVWPGLNTSDALLQPHHLARRTLHVGARSARNAVPRREPDIRCRLDHHPRQSHHRCLHR